MAQSTSTSSQPSPTTMNAMTERPRRVIIIPYPFNSPLANQLVTALDDELAVMYPDWETLPHPGFKQGKVGGDPDPVTTTSDAKVDGQAYTANPKPIISSGAREFAWWEKEADAEAESNGDDELPVLNALDADDNNTNERRKSVRTKKKGPTSRMHFHVAFDVTHLDDEQVHILLEKRQQLHHRTSDKDKSNSEFWLMKNAVGCLGLKPMPYFPHHRAAPSTDTTVESADVTDVTDTTVESAGSGPTSSESSRVYAELKRMYIAPSHRGRDKVFQLVGGSNSDKPNEKREKGEKGEKGENGEKGERGEKGEKEEKEREKGSRLADLLIAVVSDYAAHKLDVDVLVLETGNRQVPAIALYERLGWRRRADYGDYVGAGVGDGGVSMCYELALK